MLYTLLDQRLTVLAGSDAIANMPDWLRVPLSEPMFLLGVLFIIVVMFLPGGIAGAAHTFVRRRRGGGRAETVLADLDSAVDADTSGAVDDLRKETAESVPGR